MTCSDFVARFSDYIDGAAPEVDLREAEEHLVACTSCRRYKEVVERGSELLRTFPTPEITEDFRPRLQHRLYHVDAEVTLGASAGSGVPGLTVIGMALLLAAIAWAPALRFSTPDVQLPTILVSTPPTTLRYRSAPTYPFNAERIERSAAQRHPSVEPADLWEDTPALLFRYSDLSHRYHTAAAEAGSAGQER